MRTHRAAVRATATLGAAQLRDSGERIPSVTLRLRARAAIAEITDKRVARKMLEHVGVPSDAPEQWPARGPPEAGDSFGWLDDEQRAPDDEVDPVTDVE